VKVLLNDFEHGLDEVGYNKMFEPQYLPHLDRVIGPMCPASSVQNSEKRRPWSKEDKSLKFTNGSKIYFMTGGQEKKLHSGTSFDILAQDEENEEGAYDESKRGLRTGKGGGRILHALTPPYIEGSGPSWTKFRILDAAEAGESDIKIIKCAMSDNPAITAEFIERFSRGKTEEQLKVQLYGDYPTWGTMVHPDFQDRQWNPQKVEGHLLPYDWPVPFRDENYLFEMAVDWHQSKPCAAIWTCEDRDGNVYVWDELKPQEVTGKTISQLAEMFFQTEGKPQRTIRITRWADPKMKDKSNALIRGFNAWQEFRNCGIRFAEGYNRQPDVGISVVNDFFRGNTRDHPRVFIKEDCTNLRKSLRNHYFVKRPDGTGVPDPKFSDYPICLRYILQSKARKAKRGMFRRNRKWGLTSYSGDPRYGPYSGVYLQESGRMLRQYTRTA
jgi:hypothetical protein